jgi:pyrroline-5-carboxylate reductase
MRIVIVGIGGLGSALAKSALLSGVESSHLLLVDRRAAEVGDTVDLQGCCVVDRIPEDYRLGPEDLLVLAVKPQDAEQACSSVRKALVPEAVVVSVMAGVSLARLSSWLEHSQIVRAMPNLGAVVGQSATVYCIAPEVDARACGSVEKFLSSIGRAWRVHDERLVDAATAIAGSGPAYVCWLAEQMESVARELGISEPEAGGLVLQTLKATCSYLENSRQSFSELRARVTSPGGTTAAALGVLDQLDASSVVQDAIRAAFRRAREIGQ